MKDPQTEVLTSWKEIARHLDVTVRTAQLWEKARDLPVRRMPGPRGRVFMRVSELEEWVESSEVGGRPDPSSNAESAAVSNSDRRSAVVSRSPWRLAAVIGFVAAAALWVAIAAQPSVSSRPAQWRIMSNQLIVSDAEGEDLWRATLEWPLAPEKYESASRQHPQFVDLGDDGHAETLFIVRTPDAAVVNPLVCYGPEGEELWRFVPGRDVRTAKEPFENIYRVDQAVPVRLSGGEMGVGTVSVHYQYYPTQIALLSARDGTILAEYWHAGHIGNEAEALRVADYDDDGRSELYLTGISNSHQRATLVVLDLEGMTGASSEQNLDYQLQGFDEPNEIARILLPRSSMSLESGMPNAAMSVRLTPEFINVSTLERLNQPLEPQLTYHLRSDWTLDHLGTSSTFQAVHERLRREGVLTIGYDEEIEGLGPLSYIGTPRPLAKLQ